MTDSPLKKKGTGALDVLQGDFLRGVPQEDFLRSVPQGDFLRGVRRPGACVFNSRHRRDLTKHPGLLLNHSWAGFAQTAKPGLRKSFIGFIVVVAMPGAAGAGVLPGIPGGPALAAWIADARLQAGVLLVTTLYLIFVLPRLRAGISAAVTLAAIAALTGAHFALMTDLWTWSPMAAAAALLAAGHGALAIRQRSLFASRGAASDAGAAESVRMQETVIQPHQPRNSSARHAAPPADHSEKKRLGCYQVGQLLGKGAMSVVYLGRDTRSGEAVALKTLALTQEFDVDELAEVRQRFFREAETAGRLSHPNIVSVYDAGEEHGLAYIAMEFLRGRDLTPYTKPDALLPPPLVLSIMARVGEALGYAHAQGVVHRDIKPANIMYERGSDTLKVTDFGIARITDSSRTRTGMVLGTPSYMSPEQLSGQKVEGRSDLFSLGVTLYQMLSGGLPFRGASLAQLMFRIANEPHPDIRTVRNGLPACVAAIINRALAKNPDQRYQSGEQMARAIRLCLATLVPASRPAVAAI